LLLAAPGSPGGLLEQGLALDALADEDADRIHEHQADELVPAVASKRVKAQHWEPQQGRPKCSGSRPVQTVAKRRVADRHDKRCNGQRCEPCGAPERTRCVEDHVHGGETADCSLDHPERRIPERWVERPAEDLARAHPQREGGMFAWRLG
jgi:hypothetical protein